MTSGTYNTSIESPVPYPPRRVVSLVPSMTESMFELGFGDRLIGVTEYCVHPAQETARIPKIGGTKNPDIEKIIAFSPELVIANQEENRKADIEHLQAAGIPVWLTFPKTVREAFNDLWTLMHIFDSTSRVEGVRATEWTLDWLERLDESREKECRVFVPIWSEPWMTFNHETFAHDMLRVCGGKNVFAERDRLYPLSADLGETQPYDEDDSRLEGRDIRYPRVTIAEIEAQEPDIILLPNEPFLFDETHQNFFLSLNTPASKTGRVHLVEGSLLFWHGTRMAKAFDVIPHLLCL